MMKESCYKKTLIYGTIVLLIGAGVVPSITGYTEKIGIQLTKEALTSFPLGDDDYVDSYWKCDEGSGNTLGDSSGNNYDGTIYGASWVTGYSGYALDFDGAGDYVNLSSHAAEIMFNKTDDIILSFYFNSNDEGIIFSATAPWGYSPEFKIELLSNGSLLFYIITQLCGIILYSNGTYDNGGWHNATYYYNGITSNPTVTLYVDGNFDSEINHWLCEIENDDYSKTKMGMHAHSSTDYYDGRIDEFKIIKYPGGNKQGRPTIDGPKYGNSGVEYDYTFVTNDPENDSIWLEIDWDDGSDIEVTEVHGSGEEMVVSHSWDEDGAYNVTARSLDIWHHSRWSDPYVVRIGNQPPPPPTIDGIRCGDPGVEYDYTFVVEDIEEDDVQYFVDWGDGDTESTGFYHSGEVVTLSHSWASSGDYVIEAWAEDDHDNEGESSMYPVRMGNQHPNTPDIDGPIRGGAGMEHTFYFTVTDPEEDDVYYEVDWDDGNVEDYGPYASGEEAEISHIWEKQGKYIIKARARDGFCGFYSVWSEYKFTAPRNKPVSFDINLLSRLFSRFPDGSLIVGRLLDL